MFFLPYFFAGLQLEAQNFFRHYFYCCRCRVSSQT